MLKSLVCVTLLFVKDFVVCKPDYLFNNEVNRWLKLHAVPATWQEAFLNCHYEGAVLASPLNAKLDTALRKIMTQSNLDNSIFLGAVSFSPGDFFSIEGVPLADFSITWGTYGHGEEPKDCLSLSTDGKTYFSSCSVSLPYICYKKKDNTTILNECGTFDDDYKLHRVTGSCYKHHKNTRHTWTTAHKICSAEGAHLLIINDQREANIIKKDYLNSLSDSSHRGEAAYIGLRDWTGQGWTPGDTWLTIHGEKIEDLFNKWAKGKPLRSGQGIQFCGLFSRQGTVDSVECDLKGATYSFICEKDPKTSRFEDI